VSRSYGHEGRDGKIFQPYYVSDSTFHGYTEVSRVAITLTRHRR